MALGILAFNPPTHRPALYVWTNGEACILADSAEAAERSWVATMDRRYRGLAWVPAVHPIVIELRPPFTMRLPPVPTAKLPWAWVDCMVLASRWLTGGQGRARTLPEAGGTLDGVPGRAR